jgi:hypothetical protein
MVVAGREEAGAYAHREETVMAGLTTREDHLLVTSGTNLRLVVVMITGPYDLLPLAASGAERSIDLGIVHLRDMTDGTAGGQDLHMEEIDDTEVLVPGDEVHMTAIQTYRSRAVLRGTFQTCRSLSWMMLTGKDC